MTADHRGRWALLVGINEYPNFGSDVQLEGCVHDVQILRDALMRRFDFPEDRMAVLLNENATRDAILAAMEDLVRQVGEDDVVVFHFSGHGSQQTDGPEADEPDGRDETIVPYDSGRLPFHQNRDIADDEIHGWLLRLTAKTPYVTLIIDACHSGTVVRTDFGGNVRRVGPDLRPWEDLAVSASRVGRGPARQVLRGAVGDGPSGWLPLGERYVLMAACASMETAREIRVGEAGEVRHGALTYFVVQELMSPDFTGGTYLELFERLAPRVKARSLSQNPQVEGARHREIFGVREIRPMPFLSIRSREGAVVVLDGGGACGLTVGSEWDVYAQGTRSVQEAAKIGKIAITAVRATSSEARILEEWTKAGIQAGARAVEAAHSLEAARLRVQIEAPPDRRPGMVDFLLSTGRVVEAGPGEAIDARLTLAPDRWEALLADGTSLLGPTLFRDHDENLRLLRENLESAARLRGITSLRNDASPLHGQVDLTLYRLEDGRRLPPDLDGNGEPVFQEGDRVVLEVRNRSAEPVYIYILDIGLTGKIALVHPPEGSHEYLEPGLTFRVGQREGDERELFLPADFGRPRGRETVKLFVTTSPAHFGLLFTAGLRYRIAEAKSLNDFLKATFGEGGQGVYRSGEEEDWTTVERSFWVRGREEDVP